MKETPYEIRDEAMADFLKALKATRAKKDLRKFEVKFRSKKDDTQCIAVLKKPLGTQERRIFVHFQQGQAAFRTASS